MHQSISFSHQMRTKLWVFRCPRLNLHYFSFGLCKWHQLNLILLICAEGEKRTCYWKALHIWDPRTYDSNISNKTVWKRRNGKRYLGYRFKRLMFLHLVQCFADMLVKSEQSSVTCSGFFWIVNIWLGPITHVKCQLWWCASHHLYLTWNSCNAEMFSRKVFIDFLRGLIEVDPLKRWTPHEVQVFPSSIS